MRYVKKGLRFNMGIFIDIFPLDGVPDDPLVLQLQRRKLSSYVPYMTQVYGRGFGGTRGWLRHYYYATKFFLKGRTAVCQGREESVAKYAISECQMTACGLLCFGYETREKWPSAFFEEKPVELPFEYLKIKVPRQYERMLEMTYGDWHKFVRGASFHGELIQDTQIPYKQKLRDMGVKW